jgi:hypothetical protein
MGIAPNKSIGHRTPSCYFHPWFTQPSPSANLANHKSTSAFLKRRLPLIFSTGNGRFFIDPLILHACGFRTLLEECFRIFTANLNFQASRLRTGTRSLSFDLLNKVERPRAPEQRR